MSDNKALIAATAQRLVLEHKVRNPRKVRKVIDGQLYELCRLPLDDEDHRLNDLVFLLVQRARVRDAEVVSQIRETLSALMRGAAQ